MSVPPSINPSPLVHAGISLMTNSIDPSGVANAAIESGAPQWCLMTAWNYVDSCLQESIKSVVSCILNPQCYLQVLFPQNHQMD